MERDRRQGDGDGCRRLVRTIMNLAALLRHPCGVCSRPVAWGAKWCPSCGARGALMTYGPAHVGLRHWLFAIVVVAIPIAALLAARGR